MRTGLSLLMSLMLLACTGGDGGVDKLFSDVQPEEVAAHEVLAELPPVDLAKIAAPEDIFELSLDVPSTLQCAPGEGCFMDQCVDNPDCLSGWCVQHMGENVCTQTCQEECPPGWSCKQVAGTDPDAVFICVSGFANLCRPCTASGECTSTGGAEDACVSYGEEGSFCGGPCGADGACPWGFSCKEVETVDGALLQQCVNDAGVCPCTGRSVSLGLSTTCSMTNEWGVCSGSRVCAEEGLTSCDAGEPGPEQCNGVDDDCDNEVDEPNLVDGDYINLCDDGNGCTKDKCDGAGGCSSEVLDSGSCEDDNPCTVADHCEAGQCVGAAVECDDDNPCTDDECSETGGCFFNANTAPCDDGDPCTVADTCGDGECLGVAVSCDCQTDADCAALDDGDVCNGSLFCDLDKLPYLCAIAPGSAVECPVPAGEGSECLQATCDPVTGQCGTGPDNENYLCDDGNGCTVGETCQAGECAGGGQVNCADDNPCTEDFCEAGAGCVHVNTKLTCQDGDACTVGDACLDGACVPGPAKSCDDSNPCTGDSCDPQTGCVHQLLTADCDDGNPCTTGDQCVNGVCTGLAVVDCDDGNPCTKDLCLPGGGCSNVSIPGPCDDGDGCTLGDSCQNGQCQSGAPKLCDDGNGCTADTCVGGSCLFAPADGDCDDLNACTQGDTCINGECAGLEGVECEDDNPCTSEYCDPVMGCVFSTNTYPCDDGNPCTTGDQCANGSCTGTGALICNDDNECTLDNCSPDSGCTFSPWEGDCDDGNACTVQDACSGGQCVGQKILECDDGNPCTNDLCSPGEGGCLYVPADGFCTDGDACTMNDYCEAGECLGGPTVNCNDGDVCTDDSCDPQSGCVFSTNTLSCDDGNPCTTEDECSNGSCEGTGLLNCGDGNVCTDDECDPVAGCTHSPNDAPCSDGNVCTEDDSCSGGSCQAGAPLACPDDGDQCTLGQCDPAQGCVQTPIIPCCGNGQVEAGEECDDGNLANDDGCDSGCQKEADCVDQGDDKIIYVSELNACLQALGAQFSAVSYIEVAYGNTEYLDNICQAMGYSSYNGCHGGDKCSNAAHMYPSHCNQGWLGGPCWNGCGNVNYDGFFCQ